MFFGETAVKNYSLSVSEFSPNFLTYIAANELAADAQYINKLILKN